MFTASRLLRIGARSVCRPALLDDAQPSVQRRVGRPQSPMEVTLPLCDEIALLLDLLLLLVDGVDQHRAQTVILDIVNVGHRVGCPGLNTPTVDASGAISVLFGLLTPGGLDPVPFPSGSST
jgi:hypothetical protein